MERKRHTHRKKKIENKIDRMDDGERETNTHRKEDREIG